MLVAARACQGAFGAFLAPAALGVLTTTFSDPKERGKAFGIFGAIVEQRRRAVGLVLGGLLTEYLSWRWCLYVNLFFAGIAAVGGATLLQRHRAEQQPRLDVLGVVLAAASMFCLVYGFSNAAAHSWHTPSTYGFLAAGVLLLVAFGWWQTRAANPLLPPRIVADRNRGGSYLAVLILGAGMFGIFLFLTYYLQQTLGFSPVTAGVAVLPMVAIIALTANLSTIVLLPRVGPKPLVTVGMLLAAAGMAWLTRIGLHSGYASAVLGPLLVVSAGVRVHDRAVDQHRTGPSAVAPAGRGRGLGHGRTPAQQIGGSIGTSLLNTPGSQRYRELPDGAHRGGSRAPGPAAGRPGPGPRVHHRVSGGRQRFSAAQRGRSTARCCGRGPLTRRRAARRAARAARDPGLGHPGHAASRLGAHL